MENAIVQSETYDTKPKGAFSTSLFGFKRKDVLTYVENLCNENAIKQSQLSQTVYALREQLNNQALQSSTAQEEFAKNLEEQKLKYEEVSEQLSEALNEAGNYKSRLFDKEQEYIALKSQNTNLEQQNADLLRQVESIKNAMDEKQRIQDERERNLQIQLQDIEQKRGQLEAEAAEKLDEAKQRAEYMVRQAEQRAEGIMLESEQKVERHKQLMAAGIQQLSDSLASLKGDLSSVEGKIEMANSNIHTATQQMQNALESVETSVYQIGEQIDYYPNVKQVQPVKAETKTQEEVQQKYVQTAKTPYSVASQIEDKRHGTRGILENIARMLSEK